MAKTDRKRLQPIGVGEYTWPRPKWSKHAGTELDRQKLAQKLRPNSENDPEFRAALERENSQW